MFISLLKTEGEGDRGIKVVGWGGAGTQDKNGGRVENVSVH